MSLLDLAMPKLTVDLRQKLVPNTRTGCADRTRHMRILRKVPNLQEVIATGE
jgi:hypothetical protein